MNEQLPYLYRKIYELAKKSHYPRVEISIPEFNQATNQAVRANRKECMPIAREMERMGVIKLEPGKSGILLDWPSKKVL